MHNVDIKCQIFNPNIKTVISVPQADNLAEAVKMFGEDYCIEIINKHATFTARLDWNKRICSELLKR